MLISLSIDNCSFFLFPSRSPISSQSLFPLFLPSLLSPVTDHLLSSSLHPSSHLQESQSQHPPPRRTPEARPPPSTGEDAQRGDHRPDREARGTQEADEQVEERDWGFGGEEGGGEFDSFFVLRDETRSGRRRRRRSADLGWLWCFGVKSDGSQGQVSPGGSKSVEAGVGQSRC